MAEVMGKLQAMIVAWPGWRPDQLAAVKVPTLLAIGDRDFVRPAHAAEMAAMFPDAQLAVLPGTTHMSILRRGAWIEPMLAARIGS
jgi:pimeloyl-ACP methyl ester carboxylesterase